MGFAVLFKLQDREACTKKLDAIQQDIAQRTFTASDGRPFHITASYGLADVSSEQNNACAIHQTDDILYAQKEIAHANHGTPDRAKPAPSTLRVFITYN